MPLIPITFHSRNPPPSALPSQIINLYPPLPPPSERRSSADPGGKDKKRKSKTTSFSRASRAGSDYYTDERPSNGVGANNFHLKTDEAGAKYLERVPTIRHRPVTWVSLAGNTPLEWSAEEYWTKGWDISDATTEDSKAEGSRSGSGARKRPTPMECQAIRAVQLGMPAMVPRSAGSSVNGDARPTPSQRRKGVARMAHPQLLPGDTSNAAIGVNGNNGQSAARNGYAYLRPLNGSIITRCITPVKPKSGTGAGGGHAGVTPKKGNPAASASAASGVGGPPNGHVSGNGAAGSSGLSALNSTSASGAQGGRTTSLLSVPPRSHTTSSTKASPAPTPNRSFGTSSTVHAHAVHPYSRASDLGNDRSPNPSPREILRAQKAEEEKVRLKKESAAAARAASIAKRKKGKGGTGGAGQGTGAGGKGSRGGTRVGTPVGTPGMTRSPSREDGENDEVAAAAALEAVGAARMLDISDMPRTASTRLGQSRSVNSSPNPSSSPHPLAHPLSQSNSASGAATGLAANPTSAATAASMSAAPGAGVGLGLGIGPGSGPRASMKRTRSSGLANISTVSSATVPPPGVSSPLRAVTGPMVPPPGSFGGETPPASTHGGAGPTSGKAQGAGEGEEENGRPKRARLGKSASRSPPNGHRALIGTAANAGDARQDGAIKRSEGAGNGIGASERLHPSSAIGMARSSSVGAGGAASVNNPASVHRGHRIGTGGVGSGAAGASMRRTSSAAPTGTPSASGSGAGTGAAAVAGAGAGASLGAGTSTTGTRRLSSTSNTSDTNLSDRGMAMRARREVVLPRNLRDYDMRATPARLRYDPLPGFDGDSEEDDKYEHTKAKNDD